VCVCVGVVGVYMCVPARPGSGLARCVCMEGKRGPFAIATGKLDDDTLLWLLDDVVFVDAAVALQADFDKEKQLKDRAIEAGVKVEIAGYMSWPNCKKVYFLNGLSCAKPMFERMRQWMHTFRIINARALEALDVSARAGLQNLVDEGCKLSKNGIQFLNEPASSWLFDLGSVQLMKPGERVDPVHFDGGASVLLMAITLAGSRELRCRTTDSKEVPVQCGPGDIYIAALCGAEHFVVHPPPAMNQKLLEVRGGGPCKVVVLVRCRTFAHCMARLGGHAIRSMCIDQYLFMLRLVVLVPSLTDIDDLGTHV
jgi:hypothetical protein